MRTDFTTKQFTMLKELIDNKVVQFNEAIDRQELLDSIRFANTVNIDEYINNITNSLEGSLTAQLNL